MLYGRETWHLGQNEIGILQRTERAMVGCMCGVNVMDKMSSKVLMQMLYLNEAMAQLSTGNSVLWYEHVLRKDKSNYQRRALILRINGHGKWVDQRKPGKISC